MHLGAVLVLIGVILAALALVPAPGRRGGLYTPYLLPVAVVLIGVGVLVGRTTVS